MLRNTAFTPARVLASATAAATAAAWARLNASATWPISSPPKFSGAMSSGWTSLPALSWRMVSGSRSSASCRVSRRSLRIRPTNRLASNMAATNASRVSAATPAPAHDEPVA